MSAIHQDYLEARKHLAGIDWHDAARRMGCQPLNKGLALSFFGEIHHVTTAGCFTAEGQAVTEAVGLLLCRYACRFPATLPPEWERITFRELRGSGPLVSRFADNTLKILVTAFGRRIDDLRAGAMLLDGREEKKQSGFDLSLRFDALPHVPVYLHFNAADDLFPAQAALLFQRSAETLLDLRSLFILGTYLTGRLITR